jgi:orotidine-5'-phosphate decarboxylase
MSVEQKGFRQKLAQRQKTANTLVCVGLDPLPEKLPGCIIGGGNFAEKIYRWMRKIIETTAEYASMFKLQSAHYESIPGGREIIRWLAGFVHETQPDIPVFLDCKRGDIGRTQERYSVAHLEMDGVDGVNFSPYMGKDCMEFLMNKTKPGAAIVGLAYTSNPSAREMQEVMLADGRQYWEFTAGNILRWSIELGITDNAGLVMAAAYKRDDKIYSWHLDRSRAIIGSSLWFLIPGIGTQGGYIEDTVKKAYLGPGSIAINSSSDIIFASSGFDYAQAAAKKAKALSDQINEVLGGRVS